MLLDHVEAVHVGAVQECNKHRGKIFEIEIKGTLSRDSSCDEAIE
jgi:hypothetical protein